MNTLLTEQRRKQDKENNEFLYDENCTGDFEKSSRTDNAKRRTHIMFVEMSINIAILKIIQMFTDTGMFNMI